MKRIDRLFERLLNDGASDLHLEEGRPASYRLHGHLQAIPGEEILTRDSLFTMLQEIASPIVWKKYEDAGDADFAYALGTKARFRANYFRHYDGYGAIFRIIPSRVLTLDELKAPAVLRSFAELRSGLVLVTGPTGSGKSTTLAAILDDINTNYSRKIITIEDPVEFVHQSKKSLILHREVHDDTESFATGLRAAIKSDVDVILVGEMRDQETIELALTAVEMGILVFGTLHTNSAPKTVDRIIDTFPAKKKPQVRNVLASALQGIVAQQLLKSADGKGRFAAHEILLYTSALPGIIRSGESVKLTSMIQLGGKIGMQTMDDCLMGMVNDGKITREEAHLKALDKTRFL
jgi:twitching motility protein PilT